ncbi:LPXTG cell wall anchor domain-containing protein [Chryseobacterium sp. Ch-15]|uniref:LPXTG cell wall anchor domain-containing protein n=1 Tax=Chryseobacterium muglaense TaxID=2893752 RepID=A0A9Q3V050_9FLAO|nr:LPXTG cell wall anchor domain-containing protein [Chryseobacterium muglaense]MBD3903264.1 LPXTG cell wall anchor domain-containing protein [Chryseobacterium muglaense]MCC9036095.1 LPXTG cell wall anchor domain-containing protein [Chryseobacterium muglaense]MCM2553329.1 LPXTG cell wall anchor domain-containing protein [Chryseobacterium muglaense]
MNSVAFTNFLIIGTAYFQNGSYDEALGYLKKAENIKDNNNHLNVELLYELMANTYGKLNDTSKGQKYRIKLDSVKLTIAEKQNQSLHKIIADKTDEPTQTSNNIYILLLSGLLVVIIGVFLFLRKRKRDDIILNHPVENNLNKREIVYSKLIEMFKKNDIAFMSYFNECFPKFSQRLTDINPKIIQSEIEFCGPIKAQYFYKRYR